MSRKVKIGKRKIGQGEKCFIIAEIGSNHARDKRVVRKLIDAAAAAKFDAVKFQVYDPEEAFLKSISTTDYKLEHIYGRKPWWEVARDKILMPREWFQEMFDYARKRGLIVFSAVHRKKDIQFLLDLGSQVFKIASVDCNHLPLLKDVAKTKIPMIISTGMSSIEEIDESVKVLEGAGNKKLIMLHCVSCYPTRPEIINLRNIAMLQKRYGYPVGFSDHSISNASAIAAVALGACVIEKHITLNRRMKGPDHPFALEPKDMIELVKSVRETEKAVGQEKRQLAKDEISIRKIVRRSIAAKNCIKKGSRISLDMVKFSRPGTGLSPNVFEKKVRGKVVKCDIPAETLISWRMIR